MVRRRSPVQTWLTAPCSTRNTLFRIVSWLCETRCFSLEPLSTRNFVEMVFRVATPLAHPLLTLIKEILWKPEIYELLPWLLRLVLRVIPPTYNLLFTSRNMIEAFSGSISAAIEYGKYWKVSSTLSADQKRIILAKSCRSRQSFYLAVLFVWEFFLHSLPVIFFYLAIFVNEKEMEI